MVRAPDLLTRADNPRLIEERYVPRGDDFDRNNTAIIHKRR